MTARSMNQLDLELNDENGLSFRLLVDGVPLGTLVGNKDTVDIPYWLIAASGPMLPSYDESDPEIHIVAVCSCGEYGCGSVTCRMRSEGGTIILHAFEGDVRSGCPVTTKRRNRQIGNNCGERKAVSAKRR